MAFAIEAYKSNPAAATAVQLESEAMGTHQAFVSGLGHYSETGSVAGFKENACAEIIMADKAHFKLNHPYSSMENSWYSSSSDDYSLEGFYHLDNHQSVSSSSVDALRFIPKPCHSQSAFCRYVSRKSSAAVNSSRPGGQILHKKCFRFLKTVDESKRLARQNSSLKAFAGDIQDLQQKVCFQNKSAFQHMIAERNRRVKLKQHFSDLYSLLPKNSKRDKHSILLNTAKYLSDLKLRVAELEQRNLALDESIPEQGSRGFESHAQPFKTEGSLLYESDDVRMEQSKDIPSQVNIRITVKKNLVSCSSSVLIKVLELLREEPLEVLSITSHSDLAFNANICIAPKGEEWYSFRWQQFGDAVRQCIN